MNFLQKIAQIYQESKKAQLAICACCLFFLLSIHKLNAQALTYHYIVPSSLEMAGVKEIALAPWEVSYENTEYLLRESEWKDKWGKKEKDILDSENRKNEAGGDNINVSSSGGNSSGVFNVGNQTTNNTNISITKNESDVDQKESFYEEKNKARVQFKKDEERNKDREAELASNISVKIADAVIAECIKTKRGKSSRSKFYLKGLKTNPFVFVEREQLEKVLSEQSFGAGGLVDESSAASLGNLLGADAIITGRINASARAEKSPTVREVKKEIKEINSEGKEEKKRVFSHYEHTYTTSRIVELEVDLKLIDVESGQIMGAIPVKKTGSSSKSNTYKSQYQSEPSGAEYPLLASLKTSFDVIGSLSSDIGTEVSEYLTPKFVPTSQRIEKVKFKEFKDQQKEARRLIQVDQIHKAFPIYKAMYEANRYLAKSAYNLGLLYEAYGDYEKAIENYDTAFGLAEKKGDQKQYSAGIERATNGIKALKALASIGVEFTSQSESILKGGTAETILAERIKLKGNPKKDMHEVRGEPSPSAKVVTKVPGGREYPKLGESNGWVQILIIGDKKVWIESSYVK